MKALKTTLVSTLCGWLSVGGLHGQNTITPPPSAASHLREVREKQNTVGDVPQTGILRVPRAFQGRSVLPGWAAVVSGFRRRQRAAGGNAPSVGAVSLEGFWR